MSTSSHSQYYGAHTYSHYQHLPTPNHDQLYVLATTWQQDPNHDSYTGPSPAPFLHHPQPGADSASGSLPPPSAPPAWTSGYDRQELPGWHHAANDEPIPSRAADLYPALAGRASVPQQDRQGPVHYQHRQQHQHQHPQPHQQALILERHASTVNPPEHAFHSTETYHAPQLSPVSVHQSPISAVDPSFSNHASKLSSSIPHPQSQPASLHPVDSQAPVLSATAWDEHPTQHPFPNHSNNAFQASVTLAGQDSCITTSWPTANTGEAPVGSSAWDQNQTAQQDWSIATTAHSDHGPYAHYGASVGDFRVLSDQSPASQRSHSRKKVAKVPSSFVERQEKLKVSKRKGPLQEKQREKTHTMRKTKRICVRCRFYKSGCDEGDPCEKCEKITGHARSFREPCYREHLEDASLVRRCNGREHQEEAEFLGYDWIHNSNLFEMEILWNLPGYGPIPNAQPMRITFRPYSPRRGELDMTASVWSNTKGEVTAIQQPAYAIYDTANLVPAFERYFSSLQPAIEEWIFARIRRDEAAFLTYSEVVRMRSVNKSKALDLAMRLQCLSVVSQGYGSVWSNNIPGIREYDYRILGRSDYEAYDRKSCDRPLPGAITHQMDVAAVKYLRKLEKLFVKELTALIFKPRIKPWYELFLAFYVVFWNLGYIHHGAQDYIRSKNGTLIENQVSNVVSNQIKKWEFTCPVLLYHWRCILRGYSPFRLARDNPEELREKGHIDSEGFQYVTKVAHLFDRTNPDRFQPPLTGFAATEWSTSNQWIVRLLKEAGA